MNDKSKTLTVHLGFILLIGLCSPATGEEAGNAWNMLESPHFRIYYQSHGASARAVVDIAENFYPQLDRLMNGISMGEIEIRICDTQEQFQSAVHAPIQDWAIGCAFPLSRRIVIQNPSVISKREFQLSQIIRHEIVHVVFGQRTQKTIKAIPLWFVEGIAIYLSGEWGPHRHGVMLQHIFSKSIIPLSELVEKFPQSRELALLAYAESLNAVVWLVEIAGIEKLWEIIDYLGKGEDLNTAYKKALGWDLIRFDVDWQASLPQRYHWAAVFSSPFLFWGILAFLSVFIFLRCWQRAQRRLVELNQEESQVDAFFREESQEHKDREK